jgi:hypothetical protein
MSMIKDDRPRRLIQVALPADLVETIDALAKREMISRTAFIRRELLLAARASGRDIAVA